jgi:hypothetical protein
MKTKSTRALWIAPLALALAALACSGGSPEATATPLPRPTQKPNATATAAPARSTATKAALPTATKAQAQDTEVPTDVPSDTTPEAPFTLSSQPYTHKSGAFTVTLPDGWKVEDGDNSVFASSPDNVASIDITFTNVGAKFDDATLNTYIQAEEDNWFGTYDAYQAKDPEKQNDGSLLIFKTLNLSDGTPQSVFSYYWQDGNVIYEQDFWTDSDVYEQYADGLVQVANTMKVDSAAGAKVDAYAVVYQFTDPNNLYEFKVPYGFTHDSSTDTNTDIETFTSPDKLSYVENIEYDDGTAVSKTDAGQFALTLLKQYYDVTDLKVTNDSPQSDGSERLTWTSAAKGIDGESFFETRGTTFLLLTWVVDTNQYDFFKPVWTNLVDSYQVPEP